MSARASEIASAPGGRTSRPTSLPSRRNTRVGQSFFDPLPSGGDLYLLKKVLGNWGDRDAIAILRRCAEAARPEGCIVVLEGMVAPGRPQPISIDKVVVGGKNRWPDEIRELAQAAGLEMVASKIEMSRSQCVEFRPVTIA